MSKKKNTKISTEEMAKTQVLNLEELRKVAKYEKTISKKPAGICALLGVFMILLGVGTQGYITMTSNAKNTDTLQKNVSLRKASKTESLKKETEVSTSYKNTVVCQMAMPSKPDGTDTASTYTYYFDDEGKLKLSEKIFNVSATAGSVVGETTVTNLYAAYQAYETSVIDGYKIETKKTPTGFQVITTIDLTKLNLSTLSDVYLNNQETKPDFAIDTDSNTVKTLAEAGGYVCTIGTN